MNIHAPAFCRRAWTKFLQRQGATPAEIAAALHLSELEVRRLLSRPKARPIVRAAAPSNIAERLTR